MPSFPPTPEQVTIIEAVKSTKDNILISALAGAAKTTTLEFIAEAVDRPMLMLTFNKKIADELSQRMPGHCKCMTLNSLGHRAWGEVLGIKLRLDAGKVHSIMSELIKDLPESEAQPLWDSMGDMLKQCSWAKAHGHVPDKIAAARKCEPLLNDEEMLATSDINFTSLEEDIICETLKRSMDLALSGTIDFADQLLMPTVFRAYFPSYPIVLVDEAQDLSELNHVLLKKLARGRIIAVGDQNQAIYAFRGAHADGMAEMRARFQMTEYTLSTTFRCPPAIVEHVRWKAPHIKAWDKHPAPGEVRYWHGWSLDDIPDDAAIICRNNAPLFSIAIALLRSGRYPKLWGNDIGAALVKVMKKFGQESMPQKAALAKLREYHEEQLKRVKNKSALEDKIECLRVFLTSGNTLREAIAYAETIFRSSGRVHLMTGHKSKGHEFNEVFFLEESLLDSGEGQEDNLRYVICTRAKRTLTYIRIKERVEEDS